MKRSNETNFLKFLVEHGFKIGAVFNKEAVESNSNLKGYIVCMLPKNSEEPMNDTQIKNLKSLLDKNDYHCDKVLPPTLFTFLYNESGYVKKLTGKKLSKNAIETKWEFNVEKNEDSPFYVFDILNVEVYRLGIIIHLRKPPKILPSLAEKAWYKQ